MLTAVLSALDRQVDGWVGHANLPAMVVQPAGASGNYLRLE
jgi:hypothetical protein